MRKLTLTLLVIASAIMTAFAQKKKDLEQKTCGTHIDMEQIRRTDPARYERLQRFDDLVKQYHTSDTKRLGDPNGTIIIPVVFQVLHDGVSPFFNPTDARIQSQIDVLNEDFRRLNADRVNTPTPFQGVAADVNIEFRLACIDPNGNPTSGIVRRNV